MRGSCQTAIMPTGAVSGLRPGWPIALSPGLLAATLVVVSPSIHNVYFTHFFQISGNPGSGFFSYNSNSSIAPYDNNNPAFMHMVGPRQAFSRILRSSVHIIVRREFGFNHINNIVFFYYMITASHVVVTNQQQ